MRLDCVGPGRKSLNFRLSRVAAQFFFTIVPNLHVYNSWPPKPPKYFSVGIFEYILASMPNVCLNVLQNTLGWMPSLKMPQSPQNRSNVN